MRTNTGRAEAAAQLDRYDRELNELGRGTAAAGWKFAAVGEDGVNFNETPLRITSETRRVELRELRMATARDVVGVSTAGFVALPRASVEQQSRIAPIPAVADSEQGVRWAVATGGAALLALTLGVAWHRRRTD